MKRLVLLSVLLALAASAQLPAADGDDAPKVALILTPSQREDLARQREENVAANVYEVTLEFAAEQLEDIARVCPACRARSITCSPDCVAGGTILLYFDDAGGVSAEPMPYRNR